MVIGDIIINRIAPFEISDDKLKKLFSYYLHLSPTIESSSAKGIPMCGLDIAWQQFLTQNAIERKNYYIYADGKTITDKQLLAYDLSETDIVNKKSKGFLCCYKGGETTELECFLRHLRNSIAHSNVYFVEKGRKYIIFEDFNMNHKLTARILVSQTDLMRLRKILEV